MATPKDMSEEDLNFAENVKRLREGRQWTQGQLAERIRKSGLSNFHQTTVSRIEKKERPVKIGEAIAITDVFGENFREMVEPPMWGRVSIALKNCDHARREASKAVALFLKRQLILASFADNLGEGVQLSDARIARVDEALAHTLDQVLDDARYIIEGEELRHHPEEDFYSYESPLGHGYVRSSPGPPGPIMSREATRRQRDVRRRQGLAITRDEENHDESTEE